MVHIHGLRPRQPPIIAADAATANMPRRGQAAAHHAHRDTPVIAAARHSPVLPEHTDAKHAVPKRRKHANPRIRPIGIREHTIL